MNKEYRKTSELRLWDKNPRSIKGADFERLKSQIKKLGQYKPLLINKDNVVLGGNMRLRAYLDMGVDDVWVSVVDAQTEKEMVEYALSDNDRAGYYDEEVLAELVLSVPDLDLSQFKVDLGDAVDLQSVIDKFGPTPEVIEDDVPEDVETRCQLGDVWQLGNHRLMCGDSTKIEDVERLMDGKKADMVFTDPPYNVDYGASKNPRHKIRGIANDSMDTDNWIAFCNDFMGNMAACSRGDIYMWGAAGPEGMRMRLLLTEMGCHWSATIVWKKQQLVLSPANYQRMYEPCFYGWFGKSSFVADRKQVEVWEIDRPHNSKLHPTMKPIELCAKGITNSSVKGAGVLDLFGGSGSTLIACEQTNRTCYMMELDPHYCDVIIQRWENFTGKTATLV